MTAQQLTRRAGYDRPAVGGFAQGLIGAVAMGELASTAGATTSGVLPVAIGMGLAAAVFTLAGAWLSRPARWLYSSLGVLAFLPAARAFVRSNGCLQGPPPVLRFTAVLLLVAVAALMYLAGLLIIRRRRATAPGLALFGALHILIAASTFIAGRASANLLAVAVMVPGAALLGGLVAGNGDAVLAVASVAFGMQNIYSAATGAGCGAANVSGAVMIVAFCGAYFATRAVCAPLRTRR